MPRSPEDLLELLAAHLGSADVPRHRRPDAEGIGFDLTDPARLLDLDHPELRARLEATLARDPVAPEGALRAELRAFAGGDFELALGAAPETLRGAVVAQARRERGRPAALVVGGSAAGVAEPVRSVDFARLDDALAAIDDLGADLACLLLEPRGPAEQLAELRARATAAGAFVVLDESHCAGRLAPATVRAMLELHCDALLLGPSLAAGLPFAALLGPAPLDPPLAPPDPVVAIVAAQSIAALRAAPVDAEVAERGAALRARIAARCRAEDIAAECLGPPGLMRIVFAGQENAEPALITHHFDLELRALGVAAAPDLALPAGLGDADFERIAAAFEGAVSRIRTLLIEHNSYLSGGVAYPFDGGAAALRARGVATYRYPKLAAVDVGPTPDADGMRIAFEAAPLGAVTSSGFYLPTVLRGDFELTVRYAVQAWEPGPDSACLGLFVQNLSSTARYYAQMMSTADRPGERSAAAGLAGVLSGRRPVTGARGQLRLVRAGRRVTAMHRDADELEWSELGSLEPASTDDVIAGAKIWSKVRCGGLVVDLTELRVEAEIPNEQIPPLEPRPDPRRDRSAQGR